MSMVYHQIKTVRSGIFSLGIFPKI